MYAVGRLSSYISQGVYTVSAPFHPFGGAVDIIVVEQADGSFKSSPWYVKFGKFQGVLKTREKIVNIGINNDVQADFHMFLDHKGEAYFLKEVRDETETGFSPPSSSGDDETEEQLSSGKVKSNKFEFNVKQADFDSSIGLKNGEILVRTGSKRSRILGLFGRKSVKENGGEGVLERVTSLESAEIAADLLDVKWSTGRGIPDEGSDVGLQFNEDQGSTSILVVENASDDLVAQEGTDSCNREVDDCPASDTLCDNEVNSSNQSVGSHERDNDMYLSRACSVDDSIKVSSDKSTKINESDAECAIIDNKYEPEFVSDVPSGQESHMSQHEHECKVEEPTDEIAGVSNKESEKMVLYHEASENTILLVGFHEKKNEMEAQVHAVDPCETANVIPEVSFESEYAAIMDNDNLSSIKPLRDEFQNPSTELQWEVSSFKEDSRKVVMQSYSTKGMDGVPSDSGKSESLELNQKIISERVIRGRNFQMELEESFKNRSPENVSFHLGTTGPIHVNPKEAHKEPGSCTEIIGGNLVNVDKEANSPGISLSPFHSNSTILNQDMEEMENEDEASDHNTLSSTDDPQGLSSRSLSPRTGHLSNHLVDTSDEDQLLFGDLEDFATSGVQCEASSFPDSLEIEDDSVPSQNIEDLDHSSNMDHRSNLLPVKLIEKCSPKAFEALLEESTAKSSPMSIPGSRKCADENVEWTVESLPIIRSHIDSLEIPAVLHPLSHSLDSHSEQLRQDLLRNDVSNSSVSEVGTTPQLAEDDSTINETQIWEAFRNMLTKSLFEISRCKHELYEGMGADAAALAFDTKKEDLENCTSLPSQLMTNDDLIVRVGGRYFPWEAIASCILKMLVLGNDQSFEPEGMIDVERVENSIEGEPLRIEAPSGGSWFWPFGRRRSIATTPAQPIPDGTSDSSVVNSSESFTDAKRDDTPPIVKVAKKKVKSIVPTSEQLAALNLKEGRNVITFTFSTAMLGKQQVDARIYLWKWNTRIVISDVDGTITRSDVLGQFMPLVGKDWSHIGVTHLFSAIKENGYQLLFLSARAISQAHLTRQFLYNLKQDGKTLPDGPVVISPDGLFPSLFREVIRRAPHEFKIACLQDIRALFPPDHNPFYAGFGNRITDEISYLKLGIPKGKIFTINARGEIAVNSRFDRKSYTSLHALVDGMFPARRSAEQEDFNSYNYWRIPLPDIQL
ncbi:phosphatidate phosphatase [Ranunculus cassubicifolius]